MDFSQKRRQKYQQSLSQMFRIFPCFTSLLKLAKDSDSVFLRKELTLLGGGIYFPSDIILLEIIAEIKIVKVMMNNGDRITL